MLRRGAASASVPRTVAAIINSLFSSLDTGGEGALPLAAVLGAFRADAHPAVASCRLSPQHVWRCFRGSFEECFALVEARGKGGARYGGGAAAEAYYGAGDGLVRLPFFAEWCEGLAAACADEGAFGLVANALWGGGAGALARGRRTLAAAAAAGEGGGDGALLQQMPSYQAGVVGRGGGATNPHHPPTPSSPLQRPRKGVRRGRRILRTLWVDLGAGGGLVRAFPLLNTLPRMQIV